MFEMKTLLRLILIAVLLQPAAALAQAPVAAPDLIMRVLVIDDKPSIRIVLDDKYTISDSATGQVLMKGWDIDSRLRAEKDGFRIGSKDLKARSIKARIAGTYDLIIDGRRFRGDIEIVRKDNGKLMVINYIGLEEYLFGVLYHEVSPNWPMECLKAQAITARTFALYQARQNRFQPYDLRSDVYSQMYGGKDSEKLTTTMAVNATRGKVLAYKGDIFPAYFHATCGGATENASNLWGIDIPPLRGSACDFCKESKHYSWKRVVPLEDVAETLRENGYRIGPVRSVRVVTKNRSGRVERIEIKDETGGTVVLSGKVFRQLMGPNVVRSTMFSVRVGQGGLTLDGRGWGHGVGMCQWGAYGMAKQGKKVDQILTLYYPGAEIVSFDTLSPKS